MARMKEGWKQIPVVWAILGIIVALIVGAVGMYRFVLGDLPEIKAGIEAIRKDIRDAEERQRADLGKHVALEEASRKTLQAEVISLAQKVERRPLKATEVRQILSSVREISATEATHLDKPVVEGEPPTPAAVSNTVPPEVRDEVPRAWASAALPHSRASPPQALA